MKVKMIEDTEIGGSLAPKDSVIELDDVSAQALVDAGKATTETAVEEVEMDKVCAPDKETLNKGDKIMILSKMVKDAMLSKAATDYAGTEATDVLGQVMRDASLFALTRKMPIAGNLKIVYCNSNADSDNKPEVKKTNASTANATEITTGEYDAIPVKWFATIPVASELAEDVPSLEAYLGDELRNQLAIQLDGDILAGAFTSNYGCKGVVIDDNSGEAMFADLDAPTKEELLAMVAVIDPGVRRNATWAIAPAQWSAIVSELLTADNVGSQLITVGQAPTLFGFPVVETLSAPAAHPIVFGDFGRYFVGIRREMRVEVDKSANFGTDESVIKISGRYAGGLAAGAKIFNGVTYTSMVFASETNAS